MPSKTGARLTAAGPLHCQYPTALPEPDHADFAQIPGTRLRRPRLAEVVPQLFVRQLLRPAAHGLRQPAGDQRGPHRAGHRLRHARPPRHGDHQLRAGRQSGAQGHAGQRQGHSAGRRAAHERRHRRAAQRVQPCQGPDHAFPADLDRAQRHRHPGQLRTEDFSRQPEARPAAAGGFAGWRRGIGADPRRCARLRRAVRRQRKLQPGARARAQGLCPRGARRARSERAAAGRRRCRHARERTAGRLAAGKAPRCWCSTWPPDDFSSTTWSNHDPILFHPQPAVAGRSRLDRAGFHSGRLRQDRRICRHRRLYRVQGPAAARSRRGHRDRGGTGPGADAAGRTQGALGGAGHRRSSWPSSRPSSTTSGHRRRHSR